MMTDTAIAAIAKLTGEKVRTAKCDGTTYAVSKSWIVWYSKDDWHAVHRATCRHGRGPALSAIVADRPGDLWRTVKPVTLDIDALRRHKSLCGYTVVDVAVRLGYHPANLDVSRRLSGAMPVNLEFAQRAVAAFGRGVLGGEK